MLTIIVCFVILHMAASHILIKGHDPSIPEELQKWKKDIGNDIEKFAKYATENSACPSGSKFFFDIAMFLSVDLLAFIISRVRLHIYFLLS